MFAIEPPALGIIPVKTVAFSRGYTISTTYALRSRAYVTKEDLDGLERTPFSHILVTLTGI